MQKYKITKTGKEKKLMLTNKCIVTVSEFCYFCGLTSFTRLLFYYIHILRKTIIILIQLY